jgi:membrane-bound lytic murein transglycosylase MltF
MNFQLFLSFLLAISLIIPPCCEAKGNTLPGETKSPAALKDLSVQTGDLPALLKQRKIRVLTGLCKSDYFIIGGMGYGYQHDMIKNFGTFLNRKYKIPPPGIIVEFVPLPFDQLITNLISGHGDIAATSATITPDRLKLIAFTVPYMTGVNNVVIGHKRSLTIYTIEELSGKKVYIHKETTYDQDIQSLNRKLLKQGKKPVSIETVNPFLYQEDILELVNVGVLPYTVAEKYLADHWATMMPGLVVYEKAIVSKGDRLAWMVRKENPILKENLDEFLKKYQRGTLLGNICFNRYFKSNRFPLKLIENNDLQMFSTYAPLFRKYASMYQMDWLKVVAQAYQESHLDSKEKSNDGAIGLMQVTPEVADNKHIAISNIYEPSNNVHAGVKYMALLRDHFFNDPDLAPEERYRFILAAYNAGPTAISRMRTRAKELGYDPDKWFNNVEIVTMKEIGIQPVDYVRNIEKYYLAYSLSEFCEADRKKVIADDMK